MTNGYKDPKSHSAKNIRLGGAMATELSDEEWLTEAYSIIEKKAETQTVVTRAPGLPQSRPPRLLHLQVWRQSVSRSLHSLDLSCLLDRSLCKNGIW